MRMPHAHTMHRAILLPALARLVSAIPDRQPMSPAQVRHLRWNAPITLISLAASCLVKNGGCDQNATCTHAKATFAVQCTCKTGYTNVGTDSNVVCRRTYHLLQGDLSSANPISFVQSDARSTMVVATRMPSVHMIRRPMQRNVLARQDSPIRDVDRMSFALVRLSFAVLPTLSSSFDPFVSQTVARSIRVAVIAMRSVHMLQ